MMYNTHANISIGTCDSSTNAEAIYLNTLITFKNPPPLLGEATNNLNEKSTTSCSGQVSL